MAQARGGYASMNNDGPSPMKPLMIIGMAVMGIAVPWYFSYEPVIEEVQQQWNLVLLLLPLLLLMALIYLAYSSADHNALSYVLPASDASSIHRLGGSPVGLAILLFVILLMLCGNKQRTHPDSNYKSMKDDFFSRVLIGFMAKCMLSMMH